MLLLRVNWTEINCFNLHIQINYVALNNVLIEISVVYLKCNLISIFVFSQRLIKCDAKSLFQRKF